MREANTSRDQLSIVNNRSGPGRCPSPGEFLVTVVAKQEHRTSAAIPSSFFRTNSDFYVKPGPGQDFPSVWVVNCPPQCLEQCLAHSGYASWEQECEMPQFLIQFFLFNTIWPKTASAGQMPLQNSRQSNDYIPISHDQCKTKDPKISLVTNLATAILFTHHIGFKGHT